MRIPLAMVGFGAVATDCLLPAIERSGRFRVCAVVEPRESAHSAIGIAVPGAEIVQRHQDLDLAEIDAVIVATPNSTHSPLVSFFLSHRKSCFCEKPLALSLEDCGALKALADRTNSQLMVGHVLRFASSVQLLRKLVLGGLLGLPSYAVCEQGASRAPQGHSGFYEDPSLAGGGVLLDKGIHVLDVIQYLVGPITPVRAEILERSPSGLDDEMAVEFSLPKADRPSWLLSSRRRRLSNRLTIVFTGGVAHVDLRDPRTLRWSSVSLSGRPETVVSRLRPRDPFEVELAHFADVVQTGIPCLASANDGALALGAVLECYRLAGGDLPRCEAAQLECQG